MSIEIGQTVTARWTSSTRINPDTGKREVVMIAAGASKDRISATGKVKAINPGNGHVTLDCDGAVVVVEPDWIC